jgi:hypothetical protein
MHIGEICEELRNLGVFVAAGQKHQQFDRRFVVFDCCVVFAKFLGSVTK